MKKTLFTFLLAFLCVAGFAASVIDPLLQEEMGRRADGEKIDIIVIMNARYDRMEMNRRAGYFGNRADRREFVVNELKEYAAASQYDLRQSLSEMERNELVTAPAVLWMANAMSFSATKDAILDLAKRPDIALIGYDIQRNWIPEDESPVEVDAMREITQNVLQVNADDVWALGYTGEGVVVAVIDTGVNYNHQDVADHLWDGGTEFPHHGYDVKNNDNDPMDDHGHGSHCSGTVCGDGTSGRQTGMAPNATLMCVKCLDSSGNGGASNISAGIQWAVEHGCDLFSMSLGIPNSSVSDRTLLRQTCEAALDAGVVAAIAAGNEGDKQYSYPIPNNVRVPGSCPPPYMDDVQAVNPGGLTCSVCVGAVDYYDSPAYFTSVGPVTWSNTNFADYPLDPQIGLIRPDVCAPGVDIVSLNYQSNTGYTTMSGTSMATPCVAGCMALMLSKNINLTPAEVCQILEETAVPLSDTKSNVTGFGRIDVLAAVEAISTGPINLVSFAVNDTQGNGNHHLNPSETVSLDLTMLNNSDAPVNGLTMQLSTTTDGVTIINGSADLGSFAPGETRVFSDVFTFQVSEDMLAKQLVKFSAEVLINGELSSMFKLNVTVYDNILLYGGVVVLDDDNDNGMLEPGETATLRVFIDNDGNELASSVEGVLNSDYEHVAINVAEGSFGTVGADQMGYADFNVTLADAAPADFVIPFELTLTDAVASITSLTFNYKNACNVIFTLSDSYGDGWNGNSLEVTYSDGTPSETMTIQSGSTATYTRELATGCHVTVVFHTGSYAYECSYEITYESGDVIFSGSTDGCEFDVNCAGNVSFPEFCDPIGNLNADFDGVDVILTWDAPQSGTPTGYEVYRETELLNVVEELTYTDPNVAEGVFNYCVYAVYDDCQSEFVCIEVETIACSSVKNLAYTREDTTIEVTWEAPDDTTDLETYEVYVNGEKIAATLELNCQFELMSAGHYEVSVVAVHSDCENDENIAFDICPWAKDLISSFNAEESILTLTWTADSPVTFKVFANAELLGETDETQFDVPVTPGTVNLCVEAIGDCEVIAACVDFCLGYPVVDLIAAMDDDGNAVVSWTAPEIAPLNYSVFVNNAFSCEINETSVALNPVETLEIGENLIAVVANYGETCEPTAVSTIVTVCEGVSNLAYTYEGARVVFAWEGNASAYQLFLDDELIGSVETESYVADLEFGEHVFCVLPVDDGCTVITKACMDAVLNCQVPEGLRVVNVKEGLIQLTWDEVAVATSYVLYRNGETLADDLVEIGYSDNSMALDANYSYAVAAKCEYGISDMSQEVVVPYFTGVAENGNGVLIYPNPTADKVTIECEGMTGIEVFNVEGRRIMSVETESNTYILNGLDAGVYTVRIIIGNETIVRKVVKM